jgi:cyanamide hydratase
MSFEYYGGFLAHSVITQNGGSQDLAESVTEAIIRHQDFIEDGMITTVGQVIQFSTILGKPILPFQQADDRQHGR